MGFFDIFKKKEKKKNPLEALLEEMQNKMFPGGQAQIEEQVNEVSAKLGNRYDRNKVKGTLLYMSSLMFTSRDKSADRIVRNGALRKPDNVFTEADATTIYRYVALQQFKRAFPSADEQVFQEFYRTLGNFEGGATTDEIPGGYGEFGLCATNPVPVRGIPANEAYLSRLGLLSGEEFTWKRLGSTGAPNISDPIDMYQITTESGVDMCVIYISPYQSVISKKAPRGFYIK
jgi:hypothetical protein